MGRGTDGVHRLDPEKPHLAPEDALLAALAGCDRVLLTGPVGPDGDSIGACVSLARLLVSKGVDAEVTGTPAARYGFLPGVAQMTADEGLRSSYDAVVVMDGDCHRLTAEVSRRFAAAPIKALVDHHASTDPSPYTVAWLDVNAESTCSMLLGALLKWQVPLDVDTATLLYAGLVFDTGNFRHPNTGPDTLRLAATLLDVGIDHADIVCRILHLRSRPGLNAVGRILAGARFFGELCTAHVPLRSGNEGYDEGDLEGVVDALVNTTGTTVAALLVERSDGVKISLRSRDDRDVARLARVLHPSGGGHPRAAGVFVALSLVEAEQALRRVLDPSSAESPRAPPSKPPR